MPDTAAPLLSMRHLSVACSAVPARCGVSLNVTRNEPLGVVSESGSGKSFNYIADVKHDRPATPARLKWQQYDHLRRVQHSLQLQGKTRGLMP